MVKFKEFKNYGKRKKEKQIFWEEKRLLWTHGYFVSTIGKVSEKIVFNYIENQGK